MKSISSSAPPLGLAWICLNRANHAGQVEKLSRLSFFSLRRVVSPVKVAAMARHPLLDELFQRRNAITRVADACGISTAAVSSWETVPKARAQAVAATLGVPIDALPITGQEAA